MNTVDISDRSIADLKAMAYDLIIKIESEKHNLNTVENVLAKKQKEYKDDQIKKAIEEQEAKKNAVPAPEVKKP